MANPPAQVKVRNRLVHSDPVVGATLTVIGNNPNITPITATTNNQGIASLSLRSVDNSTCTLRVTPADTTGDPVGPAIAKIAPVPSRIFRSLEMSISVQNGKISAATVNAAQRNNGTVTLGTTPNAVVNLQPVWMASPNHQPRGSKDIDLIVVHHTGGAVIQGAINTFLSHSEGTSAHYVIDTDGQIVKMVQEAVGANHAGVSFWDGVNGVNANTIGIEIVNASGAYPEVQYMALLGLLERLFAAFGSTIPKRRIVGHSDIAHNGKDKHGNLVAPLFVLGRKSSDPGSEFDWPRLEVRGLGMIPRPGKQPSDIYADFFSIVPGGSFRRGDHDKTQKFGGKIEKKVVGSPILELQQDLQEIGYSVGTPNGDFDQKLEGAVKMFQEHFFAGSRKILGGATNGHVDRLTAEMIKSVRSPQLGDFPTRSKGDLPNAAPANAQAAFA